MRCRGAWSSRASADSDWLTLSSLPIVPEIDQSRQRVQVFFATRRSFAGDGLSEVTNRHPLNVNMVGPGFLEGLDSVWSEAQNEVEWPITQLNEVLAANDFCPLVIRQRESQILERRD